MSLWPLPHSGPLPSLSTNRQNHPTALGLGRLSPHAQFLGRGGITGRTHSVGCPLQVEQLFALTPMDLAGNIDYKSLCYIITHGDEKEE